MRRLILAVGAGLLAAAMAMPSLAADLPRPVYKAAPNFVAPFSWTGFYVGLNGGYAWGKADVSNSAGSFTTGSTDGGLLGGTLGYNLQTGNWVWGIETDIDYAFIKGNTSNAATCSGGTCELKNTWLGTTRGRIGYALGRWLPYFTGGAAYGSAKISTPLGSETDTSLGWTLGGGVEYAFLGAWSAKLEYLYADLGKFSCSASVCALSTTYEPKINMVRVGLNYRF